MSQRWVSTLENGHTQMPRPERIRRLADALGVDRGVLIAAADYTASPDVARELGRRRAGDDPAAARLRRAHEVLDPYLPRLSDAQLTTLKRTAELFATTAAGSGGEAEPGPARETGDGPEDEPPA